MGQVISSTEVHINTQDPKRIRAAEMLDRMIANGSVDTLSPFDPAFVDKVKAGNLLMLPAASWYGEYVFGGKPDSTYYQSAEGQLGVALPLKWKDEDQPFTGFHGGSAWTVSRHTENPELAVDFAKFMATSHEYQDTAVTFPAFLPAADVWATTVASNPVYASDPYPVLKDAASMMTLEGLGNIRYDWQSAWNTDVIAAIQAGETIVSALPKLQETYAGLGEDAGIRSLDRLSLTDRQPAIFTYVRGGSRLTLLPPNSDLDLLEETACPLTPAQSSLNHLLEKVNPKAPGNAMDSKRRTCLCCLTSSCSSPLALDLPFTR